MSFKFNPFTSQLDVVDNDPNFSYLAFAEGEELVIPENQQMTVEGYLLLGDLLDVQGEIIFTEFYQRNNYSVVSPSDPVRLLLIPESEQMLVDDLMNLSNGNIEIQGQLGLLSDSDEEQFNFECVKLNQEVTVPLNQQMFIDDLFEVQGRLNCLGSTVLQLNSDYVQDLEEILEGETHRVKTRRQMLIHDLLICQGRLRLDGSLILLRAEDIINS